MIKPIALLHDAMFSSDNFRCNKADDFEICFGLKGSFLAA